jgi:hypothetical protein
MRRTSWLREVLTVVMPRKFLTFRGGFAPWTVGFCPLLLVALAAGCSDNSTNQVTQPIELGMTNTMAPYYSDMELTLYEAQLPVPLPVRKPTDSELAALAKPIPSTPYPRAPFLTVEDESIEVHYTISNIDNQQHVVWLLIDPWNEFVRWNPGVTVVSDEETTPNWGYDLPFVVPAMSRVDGTLTTDDMHEIAIKLASVENLLASPQAMAAAGAATGDGGTAPDDPNMSDSNSGFDPVAYANNIMNPQNRSNGNDPLYTPWIPAEIAGLTGFDLGIRTSEPANVAVEITMQIQDLQGNRFVASDSNTAQIGMPPKTLSPPGAR